MSRDTKRLLYVVIETRVPWKPRDCSRSVVLREKLLTVLTYLRRVLRYILITSTLRVDLLKLCSTHVIFLLLSADFGPRLAMVLYHPVFSGAAHVQAGNSVPGSCGTSLPLIIQSSSSPVVVH